MSRVDESISLRTRLYRYLFYGWLFRDAYDGTTLERSAAIRHNVDQGRWLPTYMRRWLVGGLVLGGLERFAEHLYGDSLLAGVLTLLLIFVVLFEMITGICWAFLRIGRKHRART